MNQESSPLPFPPSSTPTPKIRVCLITTCCLLAQFPVAALAETLSMREFMARRPMWEELEKSETTLRLEGRLAAASNRLIRLRKCPLSFEPAVENFPPLGSDVKRLLITGRLDHRGDDQFFRVFTVESQPSDRKTYAIRAAAADPAEAGDWHALADWAIERGKFYEDKFLVEKASEARRRGLSVERVAAAGDRKALTAVADRADEFGNAELAREIRHEALRLRWKQVHEQPEQDPDALIKEIRQTLPGANQAIAAWPMALARAYADQPVATYNRAREVEQSILDRLFLAEVLLAEIEAHAKADGSNGEAIAAQIEAVLPERTALAERYRLREMEYRLATIETATRSEALGLARSLRDRDRSREARQALERWLGVREKTARDDGPAELVSVAEDYLSILKDRDAAARVLIEAASAHPDSEEIPQMLGRLGYEKMRDRWLSPEQIAARPSDPLEVAMREGRVTTGMSRGQVIKTLGQPERVSRSASRTRIHSVWQYGGGSGLAIHFVRRADAPLEAARVVGISKWVR